MSLGSHIDDDALESYVLGKLNKEQSAVLEEDLLICEACQENLERTDAFIDALRKAALDDQ